MAYIICVLCASDSIIAIALSDVQQRKMSLRRYSVASGPGKGRQPLRNSPSCNSMRSNNMEAQIPNFTGREEDTTGGSTYDSGFGDTKPFLKVEMQSQQPGKKIYYQRLEATDEVEGYAEINQLGNGSAVCDPLGWFIRQLGNWGYYGTIILCINCLHMI